MWALLAALASLGPPSHRVPCASAHHLSRFRRSDRCRFIATLQDPYKQVQYNDVLKTLQEEHRLLQDMEAALLEIKNVPSTSGRSSLVRRQ